MTSMIARAHDRKPPSNTGIVRTPPFSSLTGGDQVTVLARL
jgi:hypothetical protein